MTISDFGMMKWSLLTSRLSFRNKESAIIIPQSSPSEPRLAAFGDAPHNALTLAGIRYFLVAAHQTAHNQCSLVMPR